MVAYLDQQESLQSVRDKAIILLGFFGAFRRSKLVALKWEHIQFVRGGIVVQVAVLSQTQINYRGIHP